MLRSSKILEKKGMNDTIIFSDQLFCLLLLRSASYLSCIELFHNGGLYHIETIGF